MPVKRNSRGNEPSATGATDKTAAAPSTYVDGKTDPLTAALYERIGEHRQKFTV